MPIGLVLVSRMMPPIILSPSLPNPIPLQQSALPLSRLLAAIVKQALTRPSILPSSKRARIVLEEVRPLPSVPKAAPSKKATQKQGL